MMIKVSNEFLEFDELIEMEKQIKLFEDISTTDGDFSYSFELQKTLLNTKLLGNPFPDNISKPVYQQIPASILSESGAETYKGYLRVEAVTEVYRCSFFAGNNNWFARITGLLSELDLSAYDVEQTEDNIEASWLNTEGIVFPLVDNGGLLTRSYKHLKVEDLVGGFYVKTIFNRIFSEAGIKIQGELLNDWMYNNIICLKNSKDQEEINARSSFVVKTTSQALVDEVITKVQWDSDSDFPYYDGSQNNFDLANDRYLPDVKMNLKIESNLTLETPSLAFLVFIYVNGIEVYRRGIITGVAGPSININKIITVNGGDVVEIYAVQDNLGGLSRNLLSGTLKITPTFIYKTFAKAAVPNWTKQQFVSNVLRLFNVLPSFQEGSSTLTLNIFEKIKGKTPVDLSDYITGTEVDYTDFISDYGQESTFSYNEVNFDDLRNYNVGQFFKYGQGKIDVNNDFLEPVRDVIESEFSNPIAYINGAFDMSMERTNLIELDEGDSLEFTGVTDDGSGGARFAIPDDIYLVGDLLRVTDSTNPFYNGDWVIDAVATGTVDLHGLSFDTNATGNMAKLDFTYDNSDDVYLFVNIPNYAQFRFSGVTGGFDFEDGTVGSIAVAYFDLINTGRSINEDFIYSLSFGGIDDPLHYQVTMIEQYFRLFGRVLNDPVKLISTAQLPYDVFNRIDFLSPITIKTMESSNSYYLNRISGYKESYLSSTLELIKLP